MYLKSEIVDAFVQGGIIEEQSSVFIEKESMRIELNDTRTFAEIIEIFQLIEMIDEKESMRVGKIIIVNFDLTDVIISIPIATIENKCIVLFVGKEKTRNFIVDIENFNANFDRRGEMITIGCDEMKGVVIRLFTIERLLCVDFPFGRRDGEK